MLETVAVAQFGLPITRFMPLNADLTLPLPITVDPAGKGFLIGHAGTFDFSGISASDDEIPVYAKIDNGSLESKEIDLSGAVDISAVTGAELRDAFTAAGITGATFSLEATTERIKCAFASGSYWQLYGEAAEVAGFGQGFGAVFVKCNTFKSQNDEPMVKADENYTSTDANGKDFEVLSDGYRKGVTGGFVDAASDYTLIRLLEGGTINDLGDYESPTIDDSKFYFYVETAYYNYSIGTNKEDDFASYTFKRIRSAKATIAGETHERGLSDKTFNITGTSYKDESGVIWGDTVIKDEMSIETFDALNMLTV